jgi:hypothetical protein
MRVMHKLSTAFRRNDERYFRTRNLHLLAQGFALVGLDRAIGKTTSSPSARPLNWSKR